MSQQHRPLNGLTVVEAAADHASLGNQGSDLHAESGGVFPHLDQARLTSFRNSYGVGLRPRTDFAPLGWIGVDWSNEAVRFRFAFGGVE